MNFKNNKNNDNDNDNDNSSDDNNYCILFNNNDYLKVIKVNCTEHIFVHQVYFFLSILVRIDRILLCKTIIKYIILFFYLIRKILTKKRIHFSLFLTLNKIKLYEYFLISDNKYFVDTI